MKHRTSHRMTNPPVSALLLLLVAITSRQRDRQSRQQQPQRWIVSGLLDVTGNGCDISGWMIKFQHLIVVAMMMMTTISSMTGSGCRKPVLVVEAFEITSRRRRLQDKWLRNGDLDTQFARNRFYRCFPTRLLATAPLYNSDQGSSNTSSSVAATPLLSSSSSSNAYYSLIVEYEDGHNAEIYVEANETILAALERHQNHAAVMGRIMSTQKDPKSFNSKRSQLQAGGTGRLTTSTAVIPSDCRRGNCMTCAASIVVDAPFPTPTRTASLPDSTTITTTTTTTATRSSRLQDAWNLIAETDDGLSPAASQWMTQQGYVLTCCSRLCGNGLVLRLGANQEVWQRAYQDRLGDGDDHTVMLRQQARAKVIRKYAERHVQAWQAETEQIFQQQQQQRSQTQDVNRQLDARDGIDML